MLSIRQYHTFTENQRNLKVPSKIFPY